MTSVLTQEILGVFDKVFPNVKRPIPLHEPIFKGKEWDYLKECLDTGYVSSVGKFVDKFERDLEAFTGSKHAIACVNGTAALQVAYQLVGVKAGDEVLVPTLTFVGTANAVSHCGAIPHFIDSEEFTFGLDAKRLQTYLEDIALVKNGICTNKKTGRRIAALVGVHIFGHPFSVDEVSQLCERFHIPFVEDCAEALGSYYKGKHTGNFAKVSTLSFNGNKVLTTGGGGALLTNDSELAKRAKHLTTTAKRAHAWEFMHDYVAYNFRLPNINAALGVAQLEQLVGNLRNKRALSERYKGAFQKLSGLKFVEEPSHGKSNYWLNAIVLNKEHSHLRDEVLEQLHEKGIQARPAWVAMHQLPMYGENPRMDLHVAEDLVKRIVNIPSSANL